MKRYTKGFTLIELLVVIAIIGILASVVLVSLGSARNKSKNASAISSISSMRAQAELGVSTDGKYADDICTSSATGGLSGLITAANNQLGASKTTCTSDDGTAGATVLPTKWAVKGELLDSGGFYCVDYAGGASTKATQDITDYKCD